MPGRIGRLQRPRIRVAVQTPQRPALPGIKQSVGIIGGNRDAVDQHCQRTPQLRRLRIVNDRQHDGRGLDAKVDFSEPDVNPAQARTRVNAARKFAKIFMSAGVKGYSQWFPGEKNNVSDTLSQEGQRTYDKLTPILCSPFPNQMPNHFEILPLLSEISSWLISLLQQLPASKQLWEEHTTVKLESGDDGQNIASPSDAKTYSWTSLQDLSESSCLEHLQWLSGKDDSRKIAMRLWLKAQSEVPCHM